MRSIEGTAPTAGRRVRHMVAAAAGAVMAGIFAAPVTSGLAPVAIGGGTVIDIPPLDTAVGVANAEADEGKASSEATTVEVVGVEVGSTRSDGNEAKSETVVEIPVPTTSRTSTVKVAPRTTSASSSGQVSRSESHSDIVTARIPDLVEVEVLSSDAEAVWTPGASWSRGQVDGAKVTLGDGDLVIVLMHAEESSDGRRRLYLVRINDAEYFDSDAGSLILDVPDIFTIELLETHATGGTFTAEVVEAEPFEETNFDEFEDVIERESEEPIEDDDAELTSAPDDESGISDADGSGTLPITGARMMTLILGALTLIVLGFAMSAARWLIAPLRT